MKPSAAPATPQAALELGACRIINIKVGRVGGFSEAIAVHDVAQRFNVPVWCGGMLESGIGRSHNVALSTLAEFQAARRCLGLEALLEGRHHRAGSNGVETRHDCGSADARTRLRSAQRPDSAADCARRNAAGIGSAGLRRPAVVRASTPAHVADACDRKGALWIRSLSHI